MLDEIGLRPPPTGVKQARATLRAHGLLPGLPPAAIKSPRQCRGGRCQASLRSKPNSPQAGRPASATRRGLRTVGCRESERADRPALELRGVWHEIRDGPAILRGLDLRLHAGETGRADGTQRRGQVDAAAPRRRAARADAREAHAHRARGAAAAEPGGLLSARARRCRGASRRARAGPPGGAGRSAIRASSRGDERQRLALAIVLGGEASQAAVLALDEPTRGMDRAAKARLADWLCRARGRASRCSSPPMTPSSPPTSPRAVLLADGRVIADGPIEEILSGGWYFATEAARILDGADGVLRPEQGVAALRARRAETGGPSGAPGEPARDEVAEGVRRELAARVFAIVLRLARARLAGGMSARARRPKLVAVMATLAAMAALGRDAFVAVPDVKPITAIVLVSGVAFGAGPGFAVGAISGLASNVLLGQGPWTPWQMLGWGLVGLIGGAARERLAAGACRH